MSFKGRFSKRNLVSSLLKSKSIDGNGGTWDNEKSSSLPNIANTSTSTNAKSAFPDSSLNGSGLNTNKGNKTKAFIIRSLRFRSLTQARNLKDKDSFKPKSGQSDRSNFNGAVRVSYENAYDKYPGSNVPTKKDGECVTLESVQSHSQDECRIHSLDNHQFSDFPIGYLNAPKRGAQTKSLENISDCSKSNDTQSSINRDDIDIEYVVEQGSSCSESVDGLQKTLPPVDESGKPASIEQCPADRPPARPPKPFELRGEPLSKPRDENEHVPPQPPARQPTGSMQRTFPSIRAVKLLHGNRESGAYESIDEKPSFVAERSLPWELRKLPQQPWYWGPLTQEQAERKLRGLPNGYFLVRDSSDDRYLLSLSFNSNGRPVHTRFEHVGGLFSINDSQGYVSVVDLIEDAVRESQNGIYSFMQNINGTQTFPARLTHPVSRFTAMKSLQHLCRFVIRETFPRHFVADLPVPEKIRKYILEYQY